MYILSNSVTSIRKIYSNKALKNIRKKYHNLCNHLADKILDDLWEQDVFATKITFRAKDEDNGVWILNEITGERINYNFHTVVISGCRVIDLLHTNKIVHIDNFINELLKHNEHELCLEKIYSSIFDEETEGDILFESIDDMLNCLRGQSYYEKESSENLKVS